MLIAAPSPGDRTSYKTSARSREIRAVPDNWRRLRA
jgi:hypothetical protein